LHRDLGRTQASCLFGLTRHGTLGGNRSASIDDEAHEREKCEGQYGYEDREGSILRAELDTMAALWINPWPVPVRHG
jgi:hypothetical protein